jgi:predicted Zn-dependent peptidase
MIDEMMNFMKIFKNTAILIILIFAGVSFAFAQLSEPRQDKLLNGLKLLVWTNPKDEKVSFKLRIHGGSAFDPKNKVGVMALLADILFPTEQTKDYFEQELEGSFVVTSTYDYIQIDASGKSEAFLSMLETLSSALSNPQITEDNFVKIRGERVEKIKELLKNPKYIADKAVAKQLLNEYPYGRPQEGTLESLTKIDRFDLVFAKERFLTSDNATLTITGNVKFNLALKASKQFFGGWKKADKLVPATFASPNEPNTEKLIINSDSVEKTEVRYALRGVARSDKDYFPVKFLFDILNSREVVSKENGSDFFIRYERNLLPSVIITGVSNLSDEILSKNSSVKTAKELFENKLFGEITVAEFEKSRVKISAEIEKKSTQEKWLDVETFKLVSVKDEIQKLNAVTFPDVQRVADRLSKQPFVTVVLAKPKN